MASHEQNGSPPQNTAMDEDDWDAISLTSTAYDDSPDTEYVVEDTHQEKLDDQGALARLLVEWAKFPLDECTCRFITRTREFKHRGHRKCP